MSPIAVFRWSLVLSPAVGVAGAVYSLLAASHFSQDWQDLITWNGDGAWLLAGSPEDIEDISGIEWLTVGALLAFILVAIINQIAMYFFWPPSRHIYAIVCVIGFPLTLGGGLTVQPPAETLGYELSAFIAGVTLAMAYLPPVGEKFKRAAVD
jgi:hypothetical protein